MDEGRLGEDGGYRGERGTPSTLQKKTGFAKACSLFEGGSRMCGTHS